MTDALEVIRRAVEKAGSQKAFAKANGLSEPYVSDVMNGRRDPGPRILEAVGLERYVGYHPKAEARA